MQTRKCSEWAWRVAVATLLFVASSLIAGRGRFAGGFAAGAGDPGRHRPLFELRAPRGRSRASRLRAPVCALDRRGQQAPLDLAAARHRDRRVRSRGLGLPGRHAVLEGVLLRRAPGRDALHRAAAGRGWLYAAYEWSADGRAAVLAPERGRGGAYAFGGGRSHTIPAASDCRVCHESGGRTPVLGFSLLQLSPDRDPGALHAEARTGPRTSTSRPSSAPGSSSGCRSRCCATPPRIAAATPLERAALGYLHANCGHCHNGDGPLRNLGLQLRHRTGADRAPGVATTVGTAIHKPAPGPVAGGGAPDRPGPAGPQRPGAAHGLALGGAADAAARQQPRGRAGARAGPAMDRGHGRFLGANNRRGTGQ